MEEAWELAVVTTSAKTLHDFLQQVSKQPEALTLGLACAEVLGFGEDGVGQAFSVVYRMTNDLENDLKSSLTEEKFSRANGYYATYGKLKNFPVYGQIIKQLKGDRGILHQGLLPHLLTLDLILEGVCERPDITAPEEFFQAIQDAKKALDDLKLPKNLHTAILERINQVNQSIENFEIMGVDSVSQSLEQLLGAFELYVPPEKKGGNKGLQFAKSISKTVGIVCAVIIGADKTADATVGLLSHYETVSGYLEDFSGEGAPLEFEKNEEE